ncbi:6037_t:CDS:2, partial [Gigaspora margarita]
VLVDQVGSGLGLTQVRPTWVQTQPGSDPPHVKPDPGNTKTPCNMNSTGSLPERKLLKEILERLSNLEEKQQTSENSSTSSFQTSRQLLKSCNNSAASSVRKNSNNIAPSTEDLLKGIQNTKIQSSEIITNTKTRAKGIKRTVYLYEEKKTEERKKFKTYKAIVQLSKWIRKGKKNQIQKIDAALREEINLSIREINKKLNVEIASIEELWSNKLIQDLKGW